MEIMAYKKSYRPPGATGRLSVFRAAWRATKAATVVGISFIFLSIVIHFPYDTDPSFRPKAKEVTVSSVAHKRDSEFYTSVYRPEKEKEGRNYEDVAREAAEKAGIEQKVKAFVSDFKLQDKKILEVGSGRGYLQNIVSDYTGLDISSSVAKNYHKPFVVGSATAMPFPDNSFDAIWSVWVIEHIPEPEMAFQEMRRVLKPGGVLFLYVAWNCHPWLAEGFDVRPYQDFNWRGKLVKSSIALRKNFAFTLSHLLPIRAIRWGQYALSSSAQRLHFRALQPNYEVYWEPDSDAAISLDSFETFLWFRSRGDQCLNCGGPLNESLDIREPFIVRIGKTDKRSNTTAARRSPDL